MRPPANGHNYVVVVRTSAKELNADGLFRDYGELKAAQDLYRRDADHRHLTNVLNFCPRPAKTWRGICMNGVRAVGLKTTSVRSSETPKTMGRISAMSQLTA